MEFLTDPWSWWIEPSPPTCSCNAPSLAGLLAVVATIGRRDLGGTCGAMTFLGDALAHGVLPGIALAVVIGVSPTLGALVAAAVMVGGVHVVRRHSPMPEDASIGLLFVGMLALAVVIVSAGATADVGDLHRVLFGSVTGLETADLWRQAVAAAIAVVGAFVFHRAFLVLTFDETQAALLGLRPRLTHLVLMGLVAMSVVASFEAVGSLLVFAFLVAPPTTAVLVVRRIPLVMATAVGVGSVAVVLGALISYHHDTAAGATMALVAVLFCFAVMGVGGLREAPQPAR